MHNLRKTGLVLIMMLLCHSAVAQQQQNIDWERESDTGKLEIKTTTLFKKPAKKTAKEQLEYANSLKDKESYRNAMKQYDALVRKWPNEPEAAIAQQAYAELLDDAGKYEKAFDAYQYLIERYANHFPYEDALEHQFKIANHFLRKEPKVMKTFAAPERALPLFEKIVANAPNWERSAEAQFNIGQIHEYLSNFSDAIEAYRVMQVRYAKSEFAAAAYFALAQSLCTVASKRPRDRQQTATAVAALTQFINRYHNHEYVPQAQECLVTFREKLGDMYYDPAVYYDEIAKRPKSAVIAYRDFLKRFPDSNRAEAVRARIEELEKEVVEQNED